MQRTSLSPLSSSTLPRRGADDPYPHRTQSTLAGHVLSARDRRTPIEGAQLRLEARASTALSDGLYEVGLDGLPLQAELQITARGFHPYRERVNWTSVATGGLILRDFFLIPADQPLLALAQLLYEEPPIADPLEDDEEELLLEEAVSLGFDDLDPEEVQEYEVEGWDDFAEEDELWMTDELEPDEDGLEDDVEHSLDPEQWPQPRFRR